VDGETLITLAQEGSMEQLAKCGLKMIKNQLKLKKLVQRLCPSPAPTVSTPVPGPVQVPSPTGSQLLQDRKLTQKEIATLPPEEKQTYLIKRNRVLAAVKREWPGNDAPIFRGNKENMEKLDKLVQTLAGDCQYKPPSMTWVIFGLKAIRRHCLDAINERRRQLSSGYDYMKPPAKKAKSEDGSAGSAAVTAATSIAGSSAAALQEDRETDIDQSTSQDSDMTGIIYQCRHHQI
jgi:hypothetical protein